MEHVVTIGDTVRKVACKYGLRPFDLLLFNPDLYAESSYLSPGMLLYIPSLNNQKKSSKGDLPFLTEFNQRDLIQMLAELKALNVQVEVIGHSVMGQPIYSLAIGRGDKEVFYSGGWHANEWHTSKFLTHFIHHLALSDQKNEAWLGYNVKKLLDEVKLIVVPLVNPDGVDLVLQGLYDKHPYYENVLSINKGMKRFDHWSSNIRGVDLNHQWPAGWQLEADTSPKQPWPRHYSGPYPLSEPEAIAVYQLTKRYSFQYVLAFHSQGQVIYWGYRELEPKESKKMVEHLSLVSSYTPIRTADSDAGYKDWFIQETGRPGFTIEVGVGVNPLPPEAFVEIWSNNVLLALEGLTL